MLEYSIEILKKIIFIYIAKIIIVPFAKKAVNIIFCYRK